MASCASTIVSIVLIIGSIFVNGAIHESTCPDGWTAFEGTCYLFGPTPLDFTQAIQYCTQHHNSHLIHIETAEENSFIKDRLRERKPQSWFMGLTDEASEGVWKWYDVDEPVSVDFTDWHPSQPGHDGEEDCGLLWAGFDFQWGDIPCLSKYAPICEMRSLHSDVDIIG